MAEFDWVSARFNCSLVGMFKELELAVKNDIDTLKRLQRAKALEVGGSAARELEFNSKGHVFSVTVSRVATTDIRSVEFTLLEKEISVGGNFADAPHFTISIKLTDDGLCKLAVDRHGLENWQVRRKALEILFFG